MEVAVARFFLIGHLVAYSEASHAIDSQAMMQELRAFEESESGLVNAVLQMQKLQQKSLDLVLEAVNPDGSEKKVSAPAKSLMRHEATNSQQDDDQPQVPQAHALRRHTIDESEASQPQTPQARAHQTDVIDDEATQPQAVQQKHDQPRAPQAQLQTHQQSADKSQTQAQTQVQAPASQEQLLKVSSTSLHSSKKDHRIRTIDTLKEDDWKKAVQTKFLEIQPSKPGVHHTIFASRLSNEPHSCGEPCVAHCMTGQPRDMLTMKGLWKSIKHRLFQQMSESPQVFAALALGAVQLAPSSLLEGALGYVRASQIDLTNEEVLPALDYLGVKRALLIREVCTTGTCLQEGLRLKCKAADMHIKLLYDNRTGIHTNLCEVQLSRFSDCMGLVRGYENESAMKFDWVTRTRPDVYWVRPAPLIRNLDTKQAYFAPWGACGYGGMDWFFALPRQHADTIAQFISGVQCSQFSHHLVQAHCRNCPGCECWMVAYMSANNVSFTRLPWGWAAPAKFCGPEACFADWNATPSNILGMDPRAINEPCKKDASGVVVSCPP